MITTIEVDAKEGPPQTALEFTQSYEDIEQASFRRTADNSGVLRVTGNSKVRTVIQGNGWAPGAFGHLSRGQTYLMRCAMPREVTDNTTTITLPAARRSDAGHEPIGLALVGDRLVETPITQIVANVATLTAVTGARAYRVHYWPEITVAILVNTARGQASAEFDWQLEAEEV